MKGERKRILLRSMILCSITLLLLAAGMKFIDRIQGQKYREVRSTGTDEFMQLNVVELDGVRYKKIPAVTTILIAGIDQDESEQKKGNFSNYRNGGQADFLLLLAIDHSNKQIHQLQIDRDAMTEMTILSVYGVETGTRVQQICLAHNYGINREENARYTIRAVRGLMGGLEIDGYYMLNYSAVSDLNDTLGGVTVIVPEDMTSVDLRWEKGKTVTLTGKEAETFVRTRKTVGQGTNQERMQRQNEFMQSAIALMRVRIAEAPSFLSQLLSVLKQSSVSNLSDQQLLEDINGSADYEILPISYLAGEYRTSDAGYMEFYVQENSPQRWIMANLYYAIS